MYGSNLKRSRIGIVFVPISEEAYGCSTDVMFTIAKAKGSEYQTKKLHGVKQMGYFSTNGGKIIISLVFKVPQNSLAHLSF